MKLKDWHSLDLMERASAIEDLERGRGSERDWDEWEPVAEAWEHVREIGSRLTMVPLDEGLNSISHSNYDSDPYPYIMQHESKLWEWAWDHKEELSQHINGYGWPSGGTIFTVIEHMQTIIILDEFDMLREALMAY